MAEETIDAAAKVASKNGTDPGVPSEVTLSNGITLKCQPVPPLTLRYAASSIPRPKPPVIFREDKGREEENPEHPDYKAELALWEQKQQDLSMFIMLAVGTRVESIPKEMSQPQDDDWIEPLEAAGIEMSLNTEPARYLSWLRFYALSNVKDLETIIKTVARHIGVTEEDVAAAAETFPSSEERGVDTEPATPEPGDDRDNVQRPRSRSRPQSRGARRS